MQIDYISDLHIDMYIENIKNIDKLVLMYHKIIAKNRNVGDVLLIAGDLGHFNNQNISFLKYLRDTYYTNIICVLGNHDYYLYDSHAKRIYKNSFERVNEMRNLISKENGIHCLNGNIIEINGIKFGGCDSWYDGSYLDKYYKEAYKTKDMIVSKWKRYMKDAKLISGCNDFYKLFDLEKDKINKIYKKCDVMITHVNPSIKNQHKSNRYKDRQLNAFYCFDGEKYINNTSAKYWVFGHSHGLSGFNSMNLQGMINTMGYPSESLNGRLTEMKSFKI